MTAPSTRRAVLVGSAATLAAIGPSIGNAATDADAALLALGDRWRDLRDRWKILGDDDEAPGRMSAEEANLHDDIDARMNALGAEGTEIFAAIMAIPARSVAGLALKARILAVEMDCESYDDASIEAALAHAHYNADQAAFSLAIDILRLAASSAGAAS